MIPNQSPCKQIYRDYVKRLLDLLIAAPVALLLAPLGLVIIALYYLGGERPPYLFRQLRPGLAEKPFLLTKLRTMNSATNSSGELLSDAERLTPCGRFLRRFSIDELPQLWNVISGEMSLVGPRPLLMEYLPCYSQRQHARHNVRPGITGWAQVNGRNLLSWEEKFELDLYYVEHCSFILDLRIVLKTFVQAAMGVGVSSKSSATMDKFQGSARSESTHKAR